MWLKYLSLAAAFFCFVYGSIVLRRQIAAMAPSERARFRKNVIGSLLLSSVMIGGLALYFLQHPGL